MGLFGKKNKKENVPKKEQNQTEFDNDITALLARDDIQCRQDICEAEYSKALDLIKEPTQEKIRRAYDIMGNLASQFDYVPAIMWMGDFAENVMQNLKQAVFWYKKAADMGDGNGARCYADMLMTGNGVEQDAGLAMQYYSFAAEKGVPEAAFVLGEYYRNIGDNDKALASYSQAVERGYKPAQMRINQMNK